MEEATRTNLENKKTNKKFLLLSTFGIIFVVMGHCNGVNAFLNNVFPFSSFHMALFIFISGYFFKDRKVGEFFKKKTKKLIVMYFVWNFIYGLVINLLKNVGLIHYGQDFTLYNLLLAPFYGNSNQFIFNLTAWFVITLYFVQVIYFLFNKLIKNVLHLNTELILLAVSIVIAIIELNFIENSEYIHNAYYLITRVVFLMPFYCMGQIYKKLEKYDKLNSVIYFSIILLIQIIMLQNFKTIGYNLNVLTFEHNYMVYFVCSMTGILFWTRIATILEKSIGNNKIINYIGTNTHTIMMHHVFAFYLVNTIICAIHTAFGGFADFKFELYQNSVWYVYDKNSPAVILIYVIAGIAIPLVFKYYVFDRRGAKGKH